MCPLVQRYGLRHSKDQLKFKFESLEAGDATEVVSILERMLVWVDYSSIPQRSEATLKLAIQSLSAYSSLAAEFAVSYTHLTLPTILRV